VRVWIRPADGPASTRMAKGAWVAPRWHHGEGWGARPILATRNDFVWVGCHSSPSRPFFPCPDAPCCMRTSVATPPHAVNPRVVHAWWHE
jgi:hypothetical protein